MTVLYCAGTTSHLCDYPFGIFTQIKNSVKYMTVLYCAGAASHLCDLVSSNISCTDWYQHFIK